MTAVIHFSIITLLLFPIVEPCHEQTRKSETQCETKQHYVWSFYPILWQIYVITVCVSGVARNVSRTKKKLLIKIIGALHFKFVLILPWNKVMLLFVFNSYPKKKRDEEEKGRKRKSYSRLWHPCLDLLPIA